MKKTILVSLILLVFVSARAQESGLIDDAVQGPTLDDNEQHYIGTWKHNTSSPNFYKGTLSYSNQTNAYIMLNFTGDGVKWIAEKKSTHGKAAVSLDGGQEQMIDLYAAVETRETVYQTPNTLQQGVHTLKIRVTGEKDAASTGTYVVHDFFSISVDAPSNLQDVSNTRYGKHALYTLTHGFDNTAVGYQTMLGTYSGNGNTAFGSNSVGVDKGNHNTGIGYNALAHGGGYAHDNTAVGANAMEIVQVGEGNTAVGRYAGPSVSNLWYSTALGAGARTTADNQVRIGNTSVTSIGGQVSWSTLSDGRFKKDIKEDVSGLEFITKLRPVSYTLDGDAIAKFLRAPETSQGAKTRTTPVRQTGFVAQEVDALVKKSGYVFHAVEAPKNDSDPYTIRYAEFVVPLVKAVQELAAQVKEQEAKLAEQQKELDVLRKVGATSHDLLSVGVAALYQNNPNPFSADTDIKMSLPESANQVDVVIYSLDGKQIKDLTVAQRGQAAVTIQGNELPAGMYLYALIIDGKVVDTKRMILTR